MSDLLYFIGLALLITAAVALIILVIKAIKRKPKKKTLIVMLLAIVLSIVSFVVGAKFDPQENCDHNYNVSEDTQATCSEDGHLTKECTLCGKKVTEIRKSEGHKFVEVSKQEATESMDGYIINQCSVCGYEEKTTLKAAKSQDEKPNSEKDSPEKNETSSQDQNKAKESQAFPLNPTKASKTVLDIINASNSLKCIYDWDYPTIFKSERSTVFELMKTVDNYYYTHRFNEIINMPDMVNVRLDKNTFIQTLDSPDYYYYGNMKDNKPEGYGVLYYAYSNRPMFAGVFKEGKPSGYGMSFLNLREISWECEDATFNGKEFFANGNGIRYFNHYINNNKALNSSTNNIRYNYWHEYYLKLEDIQTNNLTDAEEAEFSKQYENIDGFIQKEHLVLIPSVEYEGELKNTQCTGKGKLFYDAFQDTSERDADFIGTSCYGPLRYEGQYKNDCWNGSGKLFYYDGTLCYDGEFNNNMYHGKGTLYNSDGSVKYSGKFKNGDIAK